MELSQHMSLFDELIMAPKIDNPFPNEFFQNTWNFTPFDQTPDLLHLPAVTNNPSLVLDLISPAAAAADDQFINYCPYEEDNFQPFLDALTNSPEMLAGSLFYDDFPPMAAIHQDVEENDEFLFLENCIINGTFDQGDILSSSSYNNNVETPLIMDDDIANNVNVGTNYINGETKKSKSKKPDGQPSKNLMAERRRRKRLNDRLSMLRSIVPKISKMDRTSILGDTIDYMRELLDKIQKLREEGSTTLDEINTDHHHTNLFRDYLIKKKKKTEQLNPGDTTTQLIRNPPKFDVERRNQDTKVDVCCAAKPGLLMSTLSTLDALGLDIQQCVISCFSDFSLQASCFEVAEHRSLVSSEDVKQALFRNAGYGGRCL